MTALEVLDGAYLYSPNVYLSTAKHGRASTYHVSRRLSKICKDNNLTVSEVRHGSFIIKDFPIKAVVLFLQRIMADSNDGKCRIENYECERFMERLQKTEVAQ